MTDETLNALMRGYAAPVQDDGFSVSVMEKVEAETKRLATIRARAINAGFFIGGAIAAVQLPKFADLLGEAYVSAQARPPAESTSAEQAYLTDFLTAAPPHIWMVAAGVLGLLIWSAIDRDGLRL